MWPGQGQHFRVPKWKADQPDLRKGLCVSGPFDSDIWISERPADQERAKRLCESCPVLQACREWAIDGFHLTGPQTQNCFVLGGLTEKEIRHIRWERRPRKGPREKKPQVTDPPTGV